MKVIHFMRRPGARSFSIERLFADVRGALPADIHCEVRVSRFLSQGLFGRIYNLVEAVWRRGPVNHVTGDVHFLAIGLPPQRTILTVHDCGNLSRLRGWKRAFVKFFWFTWPLDRVRLVTTVSETTKTELVALTGIMPVKVRVIPNCVSAAFAVLSTEAKAAPTRFNAECPRVLMLGGAPNKNRERMAAALAGIPCVVDLVGKPSKSQETAFRAAGVAYRVHERVTDEELIDVYRRCDLVLFASTYEGFGLPILEAQAVGRPVVTSNCSSMVEVAGESACLVDPFDVESIRTGVLRVIGDIAYREEIVRRGYGNVRRFSAEDVAAQYAAIYREIAVST